jgi:hypothetical protein
MSDPAFDPLTENTPYTISTLPRPDNNIEFIPIYSVKPCVVACSAERRSLKTFQYKHLEFCRDSQKHKAIYDVKVYYKNKIYHTETVGFTGNSLPLFGFVDQVLDKIFLDFNDNPVNVYSHNPRSDTERENFPYTLLYPEEIPVNIQ